MTANIEWVMLQCFVAADVWARFEAHGFAAVVLLGFLLALTMVVVAASTVPRGVLGMLSRHMAPNVREHRRQYGASKPLRPAFAPTGARGPRAPGALSH